MHFFVNAVSETIRIFFATHATTVAFWGIFAVFAMGIAIVIAIKYMRLQKQTERLLTRFTEALRCQPDGFYLWLYNDIGFLSQTICSPRLAVMFNLIDGMNTGFDTLLERLKPADTEKLAGALKTMRTEQTPFSFDVTAVDETKRWTVSGFQAQSAKNLPLLDIVWFRDITDSAAEITALTESVLALKERETMFQSLFNAFPFPVWVRNEDLQIVMCNPAYLQATAPTSETPAETTAELVYEKSPREARVLAAAARASGREHKAREYVLLNGRRRLADVSEIPLRQTDAVRGRTLGFLRDVTAYRDMEMTLANHIDAHNGVLEHLKTAVAVFAPDMRLTFYNIAFLQLWDLDERWLDSSPAYGHFIDMLRDKRKLPEHRDFNAYKKKELHYFSTLVNMQEDTMHLPNGLTIRRTMTPHPLGGLLIIYEDVTDRLVLERSMHVLNDTQRALIDRMQEAVLVFSNTSRVRFVNSAYAKLWHVNVEAIESDAPTVSEMIEKQRPFFEPALDWKTTKEQLLGAFTAPSGETFQLMRPDDVVLEFTVSSLPDGGILVSYLDITQSEKYADSLKERNALLLRKTAAEAENGRQRQAFLKSFFDDISPLVTTLTDLAEIQAPDKETFRQTTRLLKNKIAESADLCLLQNASPVLELDTLDLPTFITEITTAFAGKMAEKELVFETDCTPDASFCITDRERLHLACSFLLNRLTEQAPNRTKIGLKISLDARRNTLFAFSYKKARNSAGNDINTPAFRLLADALAQQNAELSFSQQKGTQTVEILLPCLE